jgi:arsenate reductase
VRKAVALLKDRKVPFRFRDYVTDPLSAGEIRTLLRKLGSTAKEMLRTRDKAYKELRLTGREGEDKLIRHMAAHPGLLNRPIAVKGRKAVLGRPAEILLDF